MTLPAAALGDPDAVAIQVWSYDPGICATAGLAEPLSLFLSLREDPDDCTQAACGQLLQELPW